MMVALNPGFHWYDLRKDKILRFDPMQDLDRSFFLYEHRLDITMEAQVTSTEKLYHFLRDHTTSRFNQVVEHRVDKLGKQITEGVIPQSVLQSKLQAAVNRNEDDWGFRVIRTLTNLRKESDIDNNGWEESVIYR